MAYNSALGRAEYTASAAQTVFPFAFKIYSTSDVKVYQTPAGQDADDVSDILIETTDYTVTINGDLGGEVTLLVGAGAGDAITLQRSLPVDRPIEYQENGDLLAATLNTDQDYQTYLIADKESDNTRFLKLPESAQGLDAQIPPPVPLNFFQWNAAGTAIVNVSSLQADGFIWTAADVYNKTEVNTLLADKADVTDLATKVDQTDFDDKSKLWDAQTTTHDFTTDADYTLTAAQNLYGRIILTDTGVVLTVARNVITDDVPKSFIVQNNTAQDITVKTLAGTGILARPGEVMWLYNDGTNIIHTTGLLDGVTYVDPDAVGANPTAKIYPGGTVVGSTDNGDYIKHPNGDLECRGLTNEVSTATAFGTMFFTNTNPIVYPVLFDTDLPIVATGIASNPASQCWVGRLTTRSLSGIGVPSVYAGATGQLGAIMWNAKGRWK